MRKHAGISTIELLVTVALIILLFGLGSQVISSIQRTAVSDSRDLKNILSTAARHARSGIAGSAWGVYLPYDEDTRTTDRIVVFSGASYATRNSTRDIIFIFDSKARFATVSLAGDSPSSGSDHEIVFSLYSGETTQHGSIILESFGKRSTIAISPLGIPVRE